MIAPPTTWPGWMGSSRNRNAQGPPPSPGRAPATAVTRVGPSSRTPSRTTMFATAAAMSPEYSDRRRARSGRWPAVSVRRARRTQQLADADRREGDGPADGRPGRERRRVCGAHRPGAHRRCRSPSTGPPPSVRTTPTGEPRQLDADARRDDDHHADERDGDADGLGRASSVSEPTSAARTRGEAPASWRSAARSQPAGIVWRPTVQSIW